VLIRHHFHGCKAPLARASHVKWRYTKYLALTFLTLNDIISRAFASARIPVAKEPTGLSHSDGKRPDCLTMIPWQRGQSLTWDVTVATTLADSYIQLSVGIFSGRSSRYGRVKKTDQIIMRRYQLPICFSR